MEKFCWIITLWNGSKEVYSNVESAYLRLLREILKAQESEKFSMPELDDVDRDWISVIALHDFDGGQEQKYLALEKVEVKE